MQDPAAVGGRQSIAVSLEINRFPSDLISHSMVLELWTGSNPAETNECLWCWCSVSADSWCCAGNFLKSKFIVVGFPL